MAVTRARAAAVVLFVFAACGSDSKTKTLGPGEVTNQTLAGVVDGQDYDCDVQGHFRAPYLGP